MGAGLQPLGDAFFWGLKKVENLTGCAAARNVAERWDQTSMWTPWHLEHGFEKHPVEVPGVGTVHLRGPIQWVDVGTGRRVFRIVDYKWSRTRTI